MGMMDEVKEYGEMGVVIGTVLCMVGTVFALFITAFGACVVIIVLAIEKIVGLF